MKEHNRDVTLYGYETNYTSLNEKEVERKKSEEHKLIDFNKAKKWPNEKGPTSEKGGVGKLSALRGRETNCGNGRQRPRVIMNYWTA